MGAWPSAPGSSEVNISFHVIDSLPDDAAAGLMVGEREGHLYLRRDATADQLAEALTQIVTEWAESDWMYIGRAREVA